VKFLALAEMLSRVPCYHLDVGRPDETAAVLESTQENR
jgi:hypothetical protein